MAIAVISSRSWIVGDVAPTDEQKRLYQLAYDHVMTNIDRLQPGMSFAEATAKAHRLPEEFRALRYGVLAHGLGYVTNIRLFAILKMSMITVMTVKWKSV